MLIRTGCFGFFLLAAQIVSASVVITNTDAVLRFDSKGFITSLQERATNRELIAAPTPMVYTIFTNNQRSITQSIEVLDSNCYAFHLTENFGKAVFEITPFEGGWSFKVVQLDMPEVSSIRLCSLAVRCNKWRGTFGSIISDENSGVAIRSYDFSLLNTLSGNNQVLVYATNKADAVGMRFGVMGVPRTRMTRALQAMTIAAGVPVSFAGGAWSREAEECRGSYLQPVLEHAAVDDWIDLAKRGAFSTIHFRLWMETLGHYNAKTNLFPNGWSDLFDASERIHAAGLRTGIHTLTGCISPQDPWIASPLNTNLLAWTTYTLQADLTENSSEIVVKEKPIERHDTVFTYSGNGNAIRIGSEIIQYSGIRRTEPYAFTGLTRGAFNTTRATHKAGTTAAYLQQRYMAFYPDPDSPLGDKLADRISAFFNGGRFDQIYLDGAEGSGLTDRKFQHKTMRKILERLHASPVVETSAWSHHNWWQHSRVGAWDSPYFDAKRFVDMHVATVKWNREAEFLVAQMGWWAIRVPSPHYRGLFADENEYFSSQVAGMDATMSLSGLNVNKQPLTLYRNNMLTVMGWYERFRLARAWDAGVQQQLSAKRAEFRLRQDQGGAWILTPVTTVMHRVKGTLPGSDTWQADFTGLEFKPTGADARIEALYAPGDFNAPNALVVCNPGTAADPGFSHASNMVARFTRASDPVHGKTMVLQARNNGAPQRGSWVRMEFPCTPYAAPSNRRGIGVWIKGDGSGAILDLQLRGAREYSLATEDHFIKLDFKGWQYVDFVMREREVEESMKWQWNATNTRGLFHRIMHMNSLASVVFMLNNIPKDSETTVAIGETRMFVDQRITIDNPVLIVNGHQHPLPFAIASGDFAELENNVWSHYSEAGNFLGRAPLAKPLILKQAENKFALDAGSASTRRAEVTIFAKGTPFQALSKELSKEQQAQIAYEPDLDLVFAPQQGADGKSMLKVRPGESAALEIEIIGPIINPILTIGTNNVQFSVTLDMGDRLFCRDSLSWRVIDTQRVEKGTGTLNQKLPVVAGTVKLELASEQPATANATLKVVKVYTTK